MGESDVRFKNIALADGKMDRFGGKKLETQTKQETNRNRQV